MRLPTITRDWADAERFFETRPAFVRGVLPSRDRRVLMDGPLGTGKDPKSRCVISLINRSEGAVAHATVNRRVDSLFGKDSARFDI